MAAMTSFHAAVLSLGEPAGIYAAAFRQFLIYSAFILIHMTRVLIIDQLCTTTKWQHIVCGRVIQNSPPTRHVRRTSDDLCRLRGVLRAAVHDGSVPTHRSPACRQYLYCQQDISVWPRPRQQLSLSLSPRLRHLTLPHRYGHLSYHQYRRHVHRRLFHQGEVRQVRR